MVEGQSHTGLAFSRLGWLSFFIAMPFGMGRGSAAGRPRNQRLRKTNFRSLFRFVRSRARSRLLRAVVALVGGGGHNPEAG